MTDDICTYYKLTVGKSLGGEAYEGSTEVHADRFADSRCWSNALLDLAVKANVVILHGGRYAHPSDSNYLPSSDEVESAEVARIQYGAHKDSLSSRVEVKIIKLAKHLL